MLYSSNRWQSIRHIVRKHVLIFLQQRDNNTRQRFVKFISIKTCLFVQEYKYRLVCLKNTLDITRLSIKTFFFFFFFFFFCSLSFFLSLSSSFFELSVSQFFSNSFSFFNFILSSYTYLGINDTRAMVLLSFTKECLFLNLS